MDLGVRGGAPQKYILEKAPIFEESPGISGRRMVFFDITSLKSVFLRKIDCLEGFLVDIGSLGALKREETRAPGNFNLVFFLVFFVV
jgi:hypothetical protein